MQTAVDAPMPDSEARSPYWSRSDLITVCAYAAVSVMVFWRLLIDPTQRRLAGSLQDQTQHEWFLALGAHAVAHLDNPFISTLVGAPDGVNLMANTSLLGLAVPLAPITWLFGAAVTYTVVMVGGLAGTATAWYWLLRKATSQRLAAAIGSGVCAFGPAMMSHANAHANFAAQMLIPVIIWRTIRLRDPGRAARNGVILGLLVTWQYFIGPETLAYTVAATGLLVVLCARPRTVDAHSVRPFLTGLAVAGAVAAVLLAAPIWLQFFGPYSYGGLGRLTNFSNDLAAFVSRGANGVGPLQNYALNGTEQNAHFGWTLLLLLPVIAVVLRAVVTARAAVIVGVVFAILSLGDKVRVAGHNTGIPGPWLLVGNLPLFNSIPPSRLAMVCLPVVGFLVALIIDHALAGDRVRRVWWAVALAAALVPIVPVPKSVSTSPAVPTFISDGDWRQYLTHGGTLLPVPVPSQRAADAYLWQAAADFDFVLPGGYFLFPGADGQGAYGPPLRDTTQLLQTAGNPAKPAPVVDEAEKRQAQADFRYWGAELIVLPVQGPRAGVLRAIIAELMDSPGILVDDAVIWRVAAPQHGTPDFR